MNIFPYIYLFNYAYKYVILVYNALLPPKNSLFIVFLWRKNKSTIINKIAKKKKYENGTGGVNTHEKKPALFNVSFCAFLSLFG
jgi:hypothetical protein